MLVLVLVLGLGSGLAVAGCGGGQPPPPPPAPIYVPPLSEPASAGADAGTAVAKAPPEAPPTELDLLLRVWSEPSQCSEFDYFPGGGIRSFWCHRPGRASLERLRSMSSLSIFLSGPHKGDDLTLDAANDFGRYDPALVRWLVANGVPSARGTAAQRASQASYDKNVKPLATIFWVTLAKARQDTACFAAERKAYEDLIARKKLPKGYYERWFWFMNPYFCSRGLKGGDSFYYDNGFDAGVDGNVTKTVTGFWLRRSIDGTMDLFADGLKNLITAYQPELLGATRLIDPAALTRALDAGSKASASCKDPSAPQASERAEISVAPEGKLTVELARRGTTPTAGKGRAASLKNQAQLMCIKMLFELQTVPPFDGAPLHFTRTIPLR